MDLLKEVKNKETESSDLFKRMDGDRDLLYLAKYKMKDRFGKVVPGIINITLNDPAVFAANVKSSFASASQQIVVESESKKLDTHYIEDFEEGAISAANKRLEKQGRPQLNPFFDEQLCIRGRAAFRCLFRMEKDVLIPDIIPIDTRYFVYELDADGLVFGSYRTMKTQAMVDRDYPGVKISGKQAEVRDIWDRTHFEIWIAEKKVKEEAHDYGYVPFGIQVVPLGSMLQDKESFAHQGESIFFLIRDIMPELNRLVSILQTLNMRTVAGAKQYASKAGPDAELPEQSPDTLGGMIATDIGGGISLVPIEDIKRAATLLHSMMETRLQRGSLSSIDLGTLTFPLSAVALIEIGEGRDQVFLPRLQAKALLNQELAEMFTAQVLQIGGSVELGTKGHKRSFDTGKLEGEYETTYRYFTKSPKIDIARFSVATAAERYFDDKTILKDILQAEDPDGIMEKRYYDLAAKVSPAVMKNRVIMALLKRAEEGDEDAEFEAELMSAEMGMTLEQLKAGEVPKPPEQKPVKKPIEPLLPLFGKGGGKTSAKKAAELEATPRAEEGE